MGSNPEPMLNNGQKVGHSMVHDVPGYGLGDTNPRPVRPLLAPLRLVEGGAQWTGKKTKARTWEGKRTLVKHGVSCVATCEA